MSAMKTSSVVAVLLLLTWWSNGPSWAAAPPPLGAVSGEEVVTPHPGPGPEAPALSPSPVSPFATPPAATPPTPAAPGKLPGAPTPGLGPSRTVPRAVQRPATPLKPTTPPEAEAGREPSKEQGEEQGKEQNSRIIVASEDGVATIALSAGALNRLRFPDSITSAYTASEALDIVLENRTAIVSFRATRAADVLVLTSAGQYMLRLVPDRALPAQTIRLKTRKPEPHVTSSYETTLADLITAGFRRKPPEGYRIERVNRPLATTGALAWYLTLQYRGHQLSIQEYAVANTGAVPHPTRPTEVAKLFPVARAVSTDPEILNPGAWGRVIVIVDTDTLEPPEATR